MNLTSLLTAPQYDGLLQDGNWQKADLYDFTTSSTFWNRAIIITLPKMHAETNAAALIYLLQKQTHALNIWERQWGNKTPTIPDFINYFIAEKGFTNTEGQPIATEFFWDKYNPTIEGIIAEPDFEFSKNELTKPFTNFFKKEEIIEVICFDDTWDEQNFLIETKTQWVLYHWSTAA